MISSLVTNQIASWFAFCRRGGDPGVHHQSPQASPWHRLQVPSTSCRQGNPFSIFRIRVQFSAKFRLRNAYPFSSRQNIIFKIWWYFLGFTYIKGESSHLIQLLSETRGESLLICLLGSASRCWAWPDAHKTNALPAVPAAAAKSLLLVFIFRTSFCSVDPVVLNAKNRAQIEWDLIPAINVSRARLT